MQFYKYGSFETVGIDPTPNKASTEINRYLEQRIAYKPRSRAKILIVATTTLSIFYITLYLSIFKFNLLHGFSNNSPKTKDNLTPFIKNQKSIGITTGSFLHITDFHYDKFYTAGSDPENYCHLSKKSHTYSSTLSSNQNKEVALEYGTPYSKCDSPDSLLKITSNYVINNILDMINFVVITGDNVRYLKSDTLLHDRDPNIPLTKELVFEHHKHIFENFRKMFDSQLITNGKRNKNVDIVFSIGNNDIHPHNMLKSHKKKNKNIYYKFLNEMLKGNTKLNQTSWIDKSQSKVFLKGGYYSRDIPNTNYKVISLNTMHFFLKNKYVGGCNSENSVGLAQLGWLRSQLKKAKKSQKSVIIIGHIMPHASNYRFSCLKEYTRTVSKFSGTIKAQLFGHVNSDLFYFVNPYDEDLGIVKTIGYNGQQKYILETAGWELRSDSGQEWWLNDDLIDENLDETLDYHPNHILAKRIYSNNSTKISKVQNISIRSKKPIIERTKNAIRSNGSHDLLQDIFSSFEKIISPKTRTRMITVASASHSIIPRYLPGFKILSYYNAFNNNTVITKHIEDSYPFYKDSKIYLMLKRWLYYIKTFFKKILYREKTKNDRFGRIYHFLAKRNSLHSESDVSKKLENELKSESTLPYKSKNYENGDILDYSVYCLNLTEISSSTGNKNIFSDASLPRNSRGGQVYSDDNISQLDSEYSPANIYKSDSGTKKSNGVRYPADLKRNSATVASNVGQESYPKFKLLYSASSLWGLQDLSTPEYLRWAGMIVSSKKSETLFCKSALLSNDLPSYLK
ncbi:Endopolyphosphatase [Smittium culicis]|uniref:Endopolyphosphatase n=1 Tax=Smittium culicis TaxID=133412 RepID=A0A1R1XWY5_9FUNG|nr:Endopolyphosphatase [Smittium culicis]